MLEFKYKDVVHDTSHGIISGRTQQIYLNGHYVGRIWYIKDGGIESAEIEEPFRRKGIYRAALLDCLEKYGESLLSFARNKQSDKFWKKFKATAPSNVLIEEKYIDKHLYYVLSKKQL